jgi:haloalkane dehalogenase
MMRIERVAGAPSEAPEWLDRESYPYRNRWLRLPSGDRIHYVDEGAGDALLFVHGTPTWSYEWRHAIGALSATHRCIAPDHVGFGLSDRPRDGAYTPAWHAANLRAFVDGLGLKSFTLVVHDYGGPIGLPLALDRPERVRGLVVLNSFCWSLQGEKDMARAARVLGGRLGHFLYRWLNLSLRVIMPTAYADRRKLTRAIHAQYLAPFRDRWARGAVLWRLARELLGSSAFYDVQWQRRDRLRDIPALIIWGMKDPAFKPRVLERWKEALPGAQVLQLPVGHWPQEEAPAQAVEALRRFVAIRGADRGV